MAEGFLAQGPAALKGGDRHQIVLHVDIETLRNSVAGRCNFEHGPSVSAETSRRLSCDFSIVPIIENARVSLSTLAEKLAVSRPRELAYGRQRTTWKRSAQGCGGGIR